MLRDYFLFFLIFAGASGSLKAEVSCQSNESKGLVLTLTTAIAQALQYNRQLLGTIENATSSQYAVDLADNEFTLQVSPNSRIGYVGGGKAGTGFSLGGGIDFNKKFVTGTQVAIGPSILKTCDHYHTELKALLVQPLLRGLGSEYQLANVLGSQFAKRLAYRTLYMAQVQLILRTVHTLYDVIKAEKSLMLHQESYQRVRQFHQASKLKEKMGLADALDVYRAEIELRHAEEGLTSAQERVQEAEDILRDLLALPLDTPIQVDVPLIYTPNPLSLEEAIQLALEHRIEIDQSYDQWNENQRLARLAKQNLYPELNLVFNYSNCGRDEIFTRSCTRHRESTWGIGFTTATDFNLASERACYEQSVLAVEAALRGTDQTKSTLTLEVKKVMRQLQRANQRIQLQEGQMKTAQGELCLAKVKFDRGMADNFNVIHAENTLRSAQQAYWSALIDHIVGEFELLASLGLLIEKPCIR